jgi:hypothetical protein
MLKGRGKSGYATFSSLKENSHPSLMTVSSLECLAYNNLIGVTTFGGLTYNKKSTSQVVK